VGTAYSNLLPQQVNEVQFEGDSIESLLRSIKSTEPDGVERSLYDDLIDTDGSYKSGWAISVNREIVAAEDLLKPVPNLSELVVIHIIQVPAGG